MLQAGVGQGDGVCAASALPVVVAQIRHQHGQRLDVAWGKRVGNAGEDVVGQCRGVSANVLVGLGCVARHDNQSAYREVVRCDDFR